MSALIRPFLPHLVIAVTISVITVGAYLAVASASRSMPKAIWSENPVTISFFAGGGAGSSGSVGDSFKCAPGVDNALLKASVSLPTRISLTTDFGPGGACGPSFTSVTITAHCVVAPSSCVGRYTGTVTVIAAYATLTPSLAVSIIVS